MKLKLAATLMVLGIVAAIFQGGAPGVANAQQEARQAAPQASSALPSAEERKRRLASFRGDGGQDLALPEPPGAGELDQETAEQYQQTLRAYYNYRQTGYDHRLRVFEWQYVSTIVIFLVVLLLVFAGIYFAAIQFHHGLRDPGAATQGGAGDTTEFVFSFKEVKVRSPVLGVIVLTLSLAFFYLYLVYVYPIENVF
jgi:hypothetical protein